MEHLLFICESFVIIKNQMVMLLGVRLADASPLYSSPMI